MTLLLILGLMLLGAAVFSDVRRTASGLATGVVAMCSGSVGGDLNCVGVLAATGWATGGSRVAAPGVSGGCTARVDACEGVREIMVGTGVGFGAGRV